MAYIATMAEMIKDDTLRCTTDDRYASNQTALNRRLLCPQVHVAAPQSAGRYGEAANWERRAVLSSTIGLEIFVSGWPRELFVDAESRSRRPNQIAEAV